jgi:very-short-patch-repair endonuclease
MKAYDEAKKGAFIRARQLRRDSTDAEKRLWRELRSKLPEYKWRRQMPIGPYFAEFACFAEKLIVELDGGQHADALDHDERRRQFIEGKGYRLLRFWNHDVLSSAEGVLEMIAAELFSPSRSDAAGPSLSRGRGVLVACQ